MRPAGAIFLSPGRFCPTCWTLSPAPDVRQTVKERRDTVASLRLDALVGSGFGLSRGKAADLIAAGRVSLDDLPCLKGDKLVEPGSKISVRGMGKLMLKDVGGRTKKDRISILLEIYC